MLDKSIRNTLAALRRAGADVGRGRGATKVTIAVGGAGCLCYLPTMLAEQLGEYKKAGVEVELVDFKGGSQSLTAVIGGSADVVSGYFDHCVNLAAKNQALEAFVVYDRYPGLALVVSPKQTGKIKSVEGSQGQEGRRQRARLLDRLLPEISAEQERRRSELGRRGRHRPCAPPRSPRWSRARSTPPSCSIRRSRCCRASNKDLKILSDTRTQKDTLDVFGGEYPGGALYTKSAWIAAHPKETQALTNAIVATLEVDSFALAGRDHGEDAGRSGRRRTRRSISRR